MSRIEEQLTQKAGEMEAMIATYLPQEEGYQKTIFEAMNYSIQAGGKRIRPVIMKAIYEMCGGKDKKVIGAFCSAIEMIHTYSLVHDDLPAMDDDDYRRGKLTTHKKYGEAMGVLAGDGLLNYAYETALCAFDECEPQNAMQIAEALQVLTRKAGVYGMVGGQVVDVEENGKFVDEDTLLFVYKTKTSALLEACFMIGGILAGCSKEERDLLEKTGTDLGIAFQIQDDVLDQIGEQEKLGKPIHSDEKNEKSTYVAIHGIEESQKKVKEYTDRALASLEQVPGEKEFISDLMIWMIDRDK